MTRKKAEVTDLAVRLKATAKAAGLKDRDIAKLYGKTPAAIRHWWAGRNRPRYADLEVYAAAVGRSPLYLLTGTENPAALFEEIQAL